MSDRRDQPNAATLIRELRDMVHSLCLERGSTANCHGLMEDASAWLLAAKERSEPDACIAAALAVLGTQGLTNYERVQAAGLILNGRDQA